MKTIRECEKCNVLVTNIYLCVIKKEVLEKVIMLCFDCVKLKWDEIISYVGV